MKSWFPLHIRCMLTAIPQPTPCTRCIDGHKQCLVPLLWSHVCYDCHTRHKACSFQVADASAEDGKKRKGKRPGTDSGRLLWHWYKSYKFHSNVARFRAAGQEEPIFDPEILPPKWFQEALKQRGTRPFPEGNGGASAANATGVVEAHVETSDTSTSPRSSPPGIHRQRTRSTSRPRSQSAYSAGSAPPLSPSPSPTDDEAAPDEAPMQVDLPAATEAVSTLAASTPAVVTAPPLAITAPPPATIAPPPAITAPPPAVTAPPPALSLGDVIWDDKEESPVPQDFTEAVAYDAVQQDMAVDDAIPEDQRRHHHADKDSLTARLTVPELPGMATDHCICYDL